MCEHKISKSTGIIVAVHSPVVHCFPVCPGWRMSQPGQTGKQWTTGL